MTMLREEELGVRPLQSELFRISGQGGSAVRKLDRGIVSLIVLNGLAARILLRFSNRQPLVSTAVISGDYDAAVLPGAVGVFPVERYKWISAVADYAGASSAGDTQLQAIGLESIVAYQPSSPGPIYGVTPAGLFVPIALDAGGRLVAGAGAGTDVGSGLFTNVAAGLAPSLPAVAGRTNYLTGFEITGAGATGASVIDVTITGLLEGTLHYELAIPAGVGVGITPLPVEFARPRPASAPNIAITLNVPSFGAGNVSAAAAIHGYLI